MSPNSTLALTLCLVSACQRPSAAPAAAIDSAPPPPPIDTITHQSGALVGGLGDLGVHSVVVPRDTTSDSARRVAEVWITVMGNEISAPPARALVTAPDGKQTGRAPGWASSVTEIPGSQYFTPVEPDDSTWEPLDVTPVMGIPLHPGRYLLELAGVRARHYMLDLSVVRSNYAKFQGGQWNCASVPDVIDTLWLTVTEDTLTVSRPCNGAE